MRRAILACAVAALALAGCYAKTTPEASAQAGVDFKVDRLFTHDGCTVYRFHDGLYGRYFTKCEGSASASTSWVESCGKNCTRPMDIPTGYTRQQ